jgi:mxaK protein
MIRRHRHRLRWLALMAVLLLLALATDGALLWREQRWNAAIAEGAPPADGERPELRFALAHAQAASGAGEVALNRYRALQDDSPLGRAARFNSANLLLRQAIVLRASNQPGQALALIELAKESYRELLRQDPQHWDARYNLERAQRLLPDPTDEELEPTAAPRDRERAATTMRSQTLGLP